MVVVVEASRQLSHSLGLAHQHVSMQVVERYPYVAMDTEFPGVVARPVGDVTASDYQYKTLKCNVDLLKVRAWVVDDSSAYVCTCMHPSGWD